MMKQTPKISVISPVYKSSDSLNELYDRLTTTLRTITDRYEIILVNDSSPLGDWKIICTLAKKDAKVKGINLSRNFGQHNAIMAGLASASGEWVVVMDCDLQDQPEEILKLYSKANEGYDIVLAKRKIRYDNVFRRLFSFIFYKVFSYLTETNLDSSIANFGIYRSNVCRAVLDVSDYVKYFPAMVQWVGFKSISIEVVHAPRKNGKTSYSYSKLVNLAINIMLAFSNKPIILVVRIGFLISLLSFILIVYYLTQYVLGNIAIIGWASMILSIWFLFGTLMFALGIIGLYIGRVYDKVKNRPNYIILSTVNE